MRADYETQLTGWNEGGLLDNSQILDNSRGGMRADYETQLTGWNEGKRAAAAAGASQLGVQLMTSSYCVDCVERRVTNAK